MRNATLFVLALLLVTGLALSEPETATLSGVSGEVMLGEGEGARILAAGDTLSEGSLLILGDGVEATVTFSDGAVMDVMGPARLSLVQMTPYMRRVDLSEGRINQFEIKEITTGIHTPYETFVAVQNGSVGVNVKPGEVTYNLFDGADAKVVDLAEGSQGLTVLTPDTPYVVTRDAPADAMAGVVRSAGDPNSRVIRVGPRTVRLTPADGFDVVSTPTGGVNVNCTVPEGEFGTVQLGLTTVLYLASGDVLELDAGGNVIRSNAIIHSLAALDIRGVYDEAIANPGDSSPIRVR
jgi:hypothetical protein